MLCYKHKFKLLGRSKGGKSLGFECENCGCRYSYKRSAVHKMLTVPGFKYRHRYQSQGWLYNYIPIKYAS